MSDKFHSSVLLSPTESKMISDALTASGRTDLADLIDEKYGCTEETAIFSEMARVLADDDLSFDDHPAVSLSGEGAFVSAWVWIPSPDESSAAA